MCVYACVGRWMGGELYFALLKVSMFVQSRKGNCQSACYQRHLRGMWLLAQIIANDIVAYKLPLIGFEGDFFPRFA